METALKTEYDQYLEEDGPLVSFSTFKKLRPRQVLPFTSHKFRECLCEYYVNMELKVKALNSHLSQFSHLQLQDHYRANQLTMCSKQNGELQKACIDGECTDCGPRLVTEHLQPALEDLRCTPATWGKWENAAMPNGSSRMMKVRKESSFEGLVEALQNGLAPFSCHLFNAKWQYIQYKDVTTSLLPGTVVLCMDFAENYTSRPQDTPQGCHWNNSQTTIHPVVASYACPVAGCTEVVTDSVIYVSDDLTHDYHAVQHFICKTVELFLSEDLHFSRIVSFSDGPPTQYKNRINFVDCSHAPSDFGVEAERHYFGSRHGKGP